MMQTSMFDRADSGLPAYAVPKRWGTAKDLRNKLIVARLPTMPQTVVQLLEVCRRKDAAIRDVARLLQRDPGLAARVLAMASAAANHARPGHGPANIEQGLMLLGKCWTTVVISAAVIDVFRRFFRNQSVDLRGFWAHSLRTALIACELANAMSHVDAGEAYLGTLLLDIGQLALLATDADAYASVFFSGGSQEVRCQREQAVFDLTHAEAGAWLIEKWNLDPVFADAVLYHHDPAARVAQAPRLVRIARLADGLADGAHVLHESERVSLCGADTIDFASLLQNAERELVTIAGLLGTALANGAMITAGGGRIEIATARHAGSDGEPRNGIPRSIMPLVRDLHGHVMDAATAGKAASRYCHPTVDHER